MDDIAIVPGPRDDFVELSRSTKGRVFRKHILSTGVLHYPSIPGGKLLIDTTFLKTLKKNFDNKVADIVQFPVVGKDNQHTEDPRDNLGEVVNLTVQDGKLYADIDVRKHAEDVGSTILGASPMFALNYVDTRTSAQTGPTLLHVAATNRPHSVELEDYSEIIAASADSSNENVFLANYIQEEKVMDLDEILASLKADHGIDVTALQARVAEAEPALALSAQLHDILNGSEVLALSNGSTASTEDIVGAVTQLATDRVELSAKYDGLVQERAEESARNEVKDLITAGRILPKDEDAFVTLRLSNETLFAQIVPEKPLVSLSAESGHEGDEDADQEKTVQAEIDRRAESPAAAQFVGKTK